MNGKVRESYVYSVLRYVHDVVAGEFINLGVLLFAPKSGRVSVRVTNTMFRLSQVFASADVASLKKSIDQAQKRFTDLSGKVASLEELFERVLPRDGGSLQWSPIGAGVASDTEVAAEELFQRFVTRPSDSYGAIERLLSSETESREVRRVPIPHASNDHSYIVFETLGTVVAGGHR